MPFCMRLYLNYNRFIKIPMISVFILGKIEIRFSNSFMRDHWFGLNWEVLNFLGLMFLQDPWLGCWFSSLNSISAISTFAIFRYVEWVSSYNVLWLWWFYWLFFNITTSDSILEALRGLLNFSGVTIALFSICDLLFSSTISWRIGF